MNYTTTEQSKKLVELGLNPGTADMCYPHFIRHGADTYNKTPEIAEGIDYPYEMPCWSLGALLEVMPDGVQTNSNRTGVSVDITFVHNGVVTDSHRVKNNTYIEAAYNMVVWLLENGYIQKGE